MPRSICTTVDEALGFQEAKWTIILDRQKVIFKPLILKKEFRYKSGISGKLRFERLNEVTWKLTNGEMTNVPACHGFWGSAIEPRGQLPGLPSRLVP